jgi:hypothetical protein
MHLTPDVAFETIQRLAHNLGVSLRHTIQQSTPKVTPFKYPSGSESAVLPRTGSVHAVDSERGDWTSGLPMQIKPPYANQASLAEVEVAIASARAAFSSLQSSGNHSSWPTSTSRSPSPSAVSIPSVVVFRFGGDCRGGGIGSPLPDSRLQARGDHTLPASLEPRLEGTVLRHPCSGCPLYPRV